MTVLFSPLLFFNVALAALSPEPVSCSERRAHLLSLLRKGVELVQRRAQEVQASNVLSEVTRGEFRQSAEWLSAWLRDHVERLEGLPSEAPRSGAKEGTVDCAVLPQIANDAHAQILPFHRMSIRASASLAIWEIDQLPHEERAAPFEEARGLLREVLEGDRDAEGMRITMRHAAFAIHQGLRTLSSHGIME